MGCATFCAFFPKTQSVTLLMRTFWRELCLQGFQVRQQVHAVDAAVGEEVEQGDPPFKVGLLETI
jgi:hypothetical protein